MTFFGKKKGPSAIVFERWCLAKEEHESRIILNRNRYETNLPDNSEPEDYDKEFVKLVSQAALLSDTEVIVNTEVSGTGTLFLQIDLRDDDRVPTISPVAKSHYHQLYIQKCSDAELSGVLIRDLQIGPEVDTIYLERCYVSRIRVNKGARAKIEMHDCWIGNFVLGEGALKRLDVFGGSIRAIDCPQPGGGNPFLGWVAMMDVILPTTPDTALFEGPQTYSYLRAHLEELENIPTANLMRARELAAERHYDQGVTWLVNWIYEFFGDHGLRAGRPLAWAALAYGVAFALVIALNGGQSSPDADLYFGWRTVLKENTIFGDIARSAFLCLQSIINPFGIFSSRTLVVPSIGISQGVLVIQGLFTDLMLFLTILGIRRRFKLP